MTEGPPTKDDAPERRYRVLLVVALLALGLATAAGGYVVGASSGPDVEDAGRMGEQAGRRLGRARGERLGYEAGYRAARETAARRAYRRSFERSCRRAVEQAETTITADAACRRRG